MILLVAGLLMVYLAGNGRPALFDRDEPRYAVTSRAMLESGDWVVPRFLGEVRTAKPPAIYWLQAGAMRIFGPGEFAVRLPGALACAATVSLLAFALPPLVGPRRAAWACFLLGTSVLVLGVAKVGVIDGVLLLCTTLMQIALLRQLRRRGGALGNALLLWIAVAAGGLLKGPVILGVLAATLLAWHLLRRLTRTGPAGLGAAHLHPLLGLLVIVIVCGPWLVLISLREPGFLPAALGHDVAARSVSGLEGHGQPPGFHLVALFATWFPWSVLLPATLLSALRRRSSVIRFVLAASVGPWLMFELIVTKLPHYLLPIFPMLAVFTADWVVRVTRGRIHLRLWEWVAAGGVYALIGLAFAAAPFALAAESPAGGAMSLGWGLATAAAWWRRRLAPALLLAGAGLTLVVALAYLDWLPRVPLLNVSRSTAEVLDNSGARQALMVHYKEPSLAWYAGTRGIVATEAGESVLETGDGFVVTTSTHLSHLPAATLARWRRVGTIQARLYNDSLRAEEVVVLHRPEQDDESIGTSRLPASH